MLCSHVDVLYTCAVALCFFFLQLFRMIYLKRFKQLYINHDQKDLIKSYFFMNGLCSNFFNSIMRVLVFANMLRCSGPVIHINVYPETLTCTCFTIHIVLSPLGCILYLFTGVAWINYMSPPHVSIPTPTSTFTRFLFTTLRPAFWMF